MTRTALPAPEMKQAKTTGRYRKVEVRTWGDARFRRLSPIPPCGQGLWLYLITGPHTTSIPGLFRAGRAAMAEDLGWELEAFDKAFDEAFREGMVKADFKARVVWIPKAIRHNRPESPNVVRSWSTEFDLIPECDLKWEALESLRASIHALGEPFAEAFEKTFPKAFGKASPKAMANQEQEQKQEQEEKAPIAPKGAGEPVGFARFWSVYPNARNRKGGRAKCLEMWRRAKLEPLADSIVAHVEAMKASPDWCKNGGEFVPMASTYLNGRRWDGAEVDGQGVSEQFAGSL